MTIDFEKMAKGFTKTAKEKGMFVGWWIPVSERLPEKGTYLICTDDGYIATIMYDRDMGWLLSSNIIAWMPLPQPYKAESEDKE